MRADEVDYVSGRTRLYGIVGDPIVQVRSPEMITAELRSRDRDAILVPLHVAPEAFDATIAGLMALRNLDGLVFTIPYKARALPLAQEIGEQAKAVGAINALGRGADGLWRGEIFDGLGCIEAFRRRGLALRGKRIQLIGAGGAGAAIAVALAHEGPRAVRLTELDAKRGATVAAKMRAIDASIDVTLAPASTDGVDVLMNASPVGMLDDARLPLDVARLPRELVVFDAIVKPETTPLVALAESCGCAVVRGREMMRGQIARMVDFFLSGTLAA